MLILQHPDEARHPLNTARLAALGLQRAELWVGETFPDLVEMIASADRVFLLFPAKGEHLGRTISIDSEPGATLLIVPDGTWRKARKLLHTNPVLNALPRLSLSGGEPSEYRIRKAPAPASISTIEAIVRALSVLEPGGDFQPLLQPFRALVEQQIRAMGPDVYRRNYSSS